MNISPTLERSRNVPSQLTTSLVQPSSVPATTPFATKADQQSKQSLWFSLLKPPGFARETHELNYIEGTMDGVVTISEEEEEEGAAQWKRAVVGHCIGKRPRYKYLVQATKKIWNLKGSMQVCSLEDAFFLFVFDNDEDLSQVLAKGAWVIGGRPMIVKKWSREFNQIKDHFKVSAVTDQQAGVQDTGINAGDFDDDEGGGLSLNACSRALLMQKLDRSGTATSATGPITATAVNAPAVTVPTASVLGVPPVVTPILQPPVPPLLGLSGSSLPGVPVVGVENAGVPSECLLLKNMFDPNLETEPDFDLDIKDVQDECSKFGTVKHISVDKNSAGYVYLCFDSTTSAINAQCALHGRWFAGKMITATFMLPQEYKARFPSSS